MMIRVQPTNAIGR